MSFLKINLFLVIIFRIDSAEFALKLADHYEKLYVEIKCESAPESVIVPFVTALLSQKCSKLILSLEHSNIRISLVGAEKLIQVHKLITL